MGPLDNDGASYVSTGELPSPEQVRRSLEDAYQRFRTETALATYAPPLDGFGNSVKGQLAARFLSRRLGLTLFASEPT